MVKPFQPSFLNRSDQFKEEAATRLLPPRLMADGSNPYMRENYAHLTLAGVNLSKT